MNRTATRAGSIGRAFAAVAVAVVLVFSSAGAAQASATDPPGTGNNDCSPRTYLYASGNTIVYNGWTRCSGTFQYFLQVMYGQNGGTTQYSGLLTCGGGDQLYCGLNGLYVYQTDNLAGSQQWCMATFIYWKTQQDSNLQCIWH
jgi:hypothetical protein